MTAPRRLRLRAKKRPKSEPKNESDAAAAPPRTRSIHNKLLRQVNKLAHHRKCVAAPKRAESDNPSIKLKQKVATAPNLSAEEWRAAGCRRVADTPVSSRTAARPKTPQPNRGPSLDIAVVDVVGASVASSQQGYSYGSTMGFPSQRPADSITRSLHVGLQKPRAISGGSAGAAMREMRAAVNAVLSSDGVLPVHKFLPPIKTTRQRQVTSDRPPPIACASIGSTTVPDYCFSPSSTWPDRYNIETVNSYAPNPQILSTFDASATHDTPKTPTYLLGASISHRELSTGVALALSSSQFPFPYTEGSCAQSLTQSLDVKKLAQSFEVKQSVVDEHAYSGFPSVDENEQVWSGPTQLVSLACLRERPAERIPSATDTIGYQDPLPLDNMMIVASLTAQGAPLDPPPAALAAVRALKAVVLPETSASCARIEHPHVQHAVQEVLKGASCSASRDIEKSEAAVLAASRASANTKSPPTATATHADSLVFSSRGNSCLKDLEAAMRWESSPAAGVVHPTVSTPLYPLAQTVTGDSGAVYRNPCFDPQLSTSAGGTILENVLYETPSCDYVIEDTCAETIDAAAVAVAAHMPQGGGAAATTAARKLSSDAAAVAVAAKLSNLVVTSAPPNSRPVSGSCFKGDSTGKVSLAGEIVAGEWDACENAITLELGGVPPTGSLSDMAQPEKEPAAQSQSVCGESSASKGGSSYSKLLGRVSQSCYRAGRSPSKSVGLGRRFGFRVRSGAPVDTSGSISIQTSNDVSGSKGSAGRQKEGGTAQGGSRRRGKFFSRRVTSCLNWIVRCSGASMLSSQQDEATRPSFTFVK